VPGIGGRCPARVKKLFGKNAARAKPHPFFSSGEGLFPAGTGGQKHLVIQKYLVIKESVNE